MHASSLKRRDGVHQCRRSRVVAIAGIFTRDAWSGGVSVHAGGSERPGPCSSPWLRGQVQAFRTVGFAGVVTQCGPSPRSWVLFVNRVHSWG